MHDYEPARGSPDPLPKGMTETSIDGGTLIDDELSIDGVNSLVNKIQGLVLERGRGRQRVSTMLVFEGEPWQVMFVISIANRIESGTCPSLHCSNITRAPLGQLVVELSSILPIAEVNSRPACLVWCDSVTFSAKTENLVARSGTILCLSNPLYHD